MRVRDKYGHGEGEIVGVLDYTHENAMVLVVTDDGEFRHCSTSMLTPVINTPKPDMRITVGHVIDNPTFDFNGLFEITTTDEDGTVRTLYDSAYENDDIPCELLIEPVTYMVVNESEGKLRLEVR